MQIIHTIKELREWRKQAGKVAFVPTMGNLHEGHLALVREAKKRADNVVVSIFVNRLQFGQGEDFDQYPRTLQQDADKLANEGVAVVFAPDEKELYPNVEQRYNVEPPHLQNELCGKFRPGHFRGVATVVSKLFNIVEADVACFGKKDYQQLAIIKGFVEDLNFNIEIVPVNTGRAADGLALSSRNQYLSETERAEAPRLYRELQAAAAQLQAGNVAYTQIEQTAIENLNQAGWEVDYIEIRQAESLEVARVGDKYLVVLAAARLGSTRLIDNLEVSLNL
ncbi:pantoate--beta-alanine ligase [Neisseria sp. N95_16]|uniref:Pantothenate synthetase n=1 Tax=Neisseria brasiliensis TaxID=2666100 RepID=A0A5Q3S7T0_9NEIS|nr:MULTISPECIES: pantoate--beta-alanine ligase [Neisseria]MRN39175.1 pantoate--beta-alanine ligase [Neisseria brasiliensis]PJO09401.1 pantoate--beta-alanine ligase [Neisseria sp. N95_16]PJO77953.1 pantoate--beta-alanine ligase [Neisseria sp. N177_16]QGL26168.1 pantoate--beta-alanine ligase [Neisseria brasiliensis]